MAEEVFIKARDWWRETGIFDRVKMNPKDIAESRRLQQKSFQIFPVNKSNVPIKQARNLSNIKEKKEKNWRERG